MTYGWVWFALAACNPAAEVPAWDLASPESGEWPMFKRDLAHTGLADELTGALTADAVCSRWDTPVVNERGRANSGVAVGLVDGVATVFVAVDGRCDQAGCTTEGPGAVYAIDGASGDVAWRFDLPDGADADPYGVLLADVDLDGRRELIVPSNSDNRLFAITTEDEGDGAGALQWTATFGNERSETAPTAVDIDPDTPGLEILFGTDQLTPNAPVRFLAVSAAGDLLDAVEIPDLSAASGCDGDTTFRKIDSSSPAVAEVDGRPLVFVGAWNGRFYAFEWDGGLDIAWERELPREPGLDCEVPKVRDSAVVADLNGDGHGEVVFGFMHREDQEGDGADRFHLASTAFLDVATGDEILVVPGTGDWKSSPSAADLDPAEPGLEVVAGRSYGVYALRADGTLDWQVDAEASEPGGNRSSPAIADIDGDGDLEVLIGLEADTDAQDGGLACFDGSTGELEWRVDSPDLVTEQVQRGVAASPAVADIDGDGSLEVVYLDHSGRVLALDDDCAP